MTRKLEGKIALITGGSRGIGAESLSVWPRTERAWPSHTRRTPARLPPWSKRLNSMVEKLSRSKRTLPMLRIPGHVNNRSGVM
jgi:hypothetical protein